MSSRNYVPMQQKYSRVIMLVDMDCFFCQVEEKLDPQLKGQPLAVVQYNAWRGGGIIAVNYVARAKGVTRHMRGDEAKERCPEIQLVKVPNIREKADLGKYRDAGKEVANVLQRFTPLLERASVDEAYLDITESVNKRLGGMSAGSSMLQPEGLVNTYAVGYAGIGDYVNVITRRFNNSNIEDADLETEAGAFAEAHDAGDMAARQSDIRLLIGAAIAGEVRAAVKAETGYDCSAGIAHNKILAKLACGMNKPNKQTILPLAQIPTLFETLPVGKIRGLGGKFGEEICAALQIRFLGELLPYSEQELQRKFDEKSGTWLYYICRGVDLEAVTPRFYSKSIGCCKKFPGRNNITGLNTLRHWLGELANEVCDRMEKDMLENNRRAKQMVVSFIQEFDGEEVSSSRSAPLNGYDQETLTKGSLDVIQSHTKQFFKPGSSLVLNNPIKFLGISVGKFETIQSGQGKLQEMFANLAAKKKNEITNTVTQPVCIDNASTNKNTEIAEPFVAKKPTFMQHFLGRASDHEDKPSGSSNVGTNSRDWEKSSSLESITNETMESAQPPEKRSFFLNALRKPRNNEIESQGSTVGGSDITSKYEAKSGDISNSFFAKILNNTKDETNNLTKTANASNVQLSSTESCKTTAFESKGNDFELQQKMTFIVGDTKESTSKLNKNNDTKSTKRKYTASQDNSSPTHVPQPNEIAATSKHTPPQSYEESYVEFAIPELRAELLKMTKCEICKANVPSDIRSIQLHQDHHVAMQLSQQLRDEYRTEVKAQLNKPLATSSAAPNKKAKKSLVLATKVTCTKEGGKCATSSASIMKYLKPSAQGATTSTNVPVCVAESEQFTEVINTLDDTVDTVICGECKVPVVTTELQEHKDFHIAKSLQRQLNMLEVRTVPIVKKASGGCNSTLNTTQSSIKNIKPITKFFSQSNC
ncbi:DNA polymerase eta-like [Rhagoletis pomonella]|uniref:DNA polymerase eta-like n=1 Tax=Rhagoletis pomonella TaxID=28610 RepID=UPI00177C3136|nr:DNA polymerase eta-like [Rhagoletis pomonella]